mgnify:CR=1 FL=1
MGQDWIIDVLADLRCFARNNNLPLLTAQLEEAGLVAEVEIASQPLAEKLQSRGDAGAMSGNVSKVPSPRRP